MGTRHLFLCCFTLLACSAKSKSDPAATPEIEATPAIDAGAPKTTGTAQWQSRMADIDKLVYHFQDSSVPPQYHRSFTTTVTPSEIKKVVDSYGDIISEQANAITEEQFRGLLASVGTLGIREAAEDDERDSGCTGGTSDSLALYVGDDAILKGYASRCAGDVTGSLRGDVKQVAAKAEALLLSNADAIERN